MSSYFPRIDQEFPREWWERIKRQWKNRGKISESDPAFHVMCCEICGEIHEGECGERRPSHDHP